MRTKYKSSITLRPLIIRINSQLEVDEKVKQYFETISEYSIGLAILIKETPWFCSINPNVCKYNTNTKNCEDIQIYISEEPEVDQQEKIMNFLLVISSKIAWDQPLFLGLWAMSGIVLSDLRIFKQKLEYSEFEEQHESFFEESTIRGILTADKSYLNNNLEINQQNKQIISINKILPNRQYKENPKNASWFLDSILKQNLLTRTQFNGINFIEYLQCLCQAPEISKNCIQTLKAALFSKLIKKFLSSSEKNMQPEVQQLHQHQTPYYKALQLRLLVFQLALSYFGHTNHEQIQLPNLPKQTSKINLDSMFQNKFSTQSEFELFTKQFAESVKKIQNYKKSKIKGSSTQIQGQSSIIEKLQGQASKIEQIKQINNSHLKTLNNQKITQQNLTPGHFFHTYHQSFIQVRHQYPKYQTIELVQSVPIYDQIFTAQRLYTLPQYPIQYQQSIITSYSIPQPKRKMFQCCNLI